MFRAIPVRRRVLKRECKPKQLEVQLRKEMSNLDDTDKVTKSGHSEPIGSIIVGMPGRIESFNPGTKMRIKAGVYKQLHQKCPLQIGK